MKLTFLKAHEGVGPLRKSLFMPDGANRAYPKAAQMTSFVEEIDVEKGGVKQYAATLLKYGYVPAHDIKQGGCALLKGSLTRALVNESRRGAGDKTGNTQTLVLDIDGLPLDITFKGTVGEKQVKEVAEKVLKFLPAELAECSYVAVASSSFGLSNTKVSIHLHFILNRTVPVRELKQWVTSMNYTQEAIFQKLELTDGKRGLKKIVDPSVADNTHIIYIAAPKFGDPTKNPFKNDKQRIIAVEKKTKTLDASKFLETITVKNDIVKRRNGDKLKELHATLGIKLEKAKYTRINFKGKNVSVLQNPEPINLVFEAEDHEFIRYNRSGGDSNSYWVDRTNPEILHCFKDSEEPRLFKATDPMTYGEHVKKYGESFERKKSADGVTREVVRRMFQVRGSDMILTLEYDRANNEIIEMEEHQSVAAASNWMRFWGQLIPDPIPPAYMVMDPNGKDIIYEVEGKQYINRFKPTTHMICTEKHHAIDTLKYGTAAFTMGEDCPVISEIILNTLGDDLECFEHFINWLSFIFQKRDKAETAWLVHGHEGTGKGLLFKRIIRALIGGDYAVQNTLQGIADDQFNGWAEDTLFLMVDEFNMKGTGSLTKTATLLKNWITEPTMMLRKMQHQQRNVIQRLNLLLGTNDMDAMAMSDRRRINVAPRQSRTLEERLPYLKTHRDEADKLIADELTNFATILRSFQFNRKHVTTILDNEARTDSQKAGMNTVDLFFEAINKGDFAYFIDILDKSEQNIPQDEMLQLSRAKSFITALLEHVNTGKACYLHKDDLRMLYSYRAGKEISQSAFGRMLGSHEVITKRKDNPVGARTKLATRPPCIETRWKYPDEDVLVRLKAFNHQMPGVGTTKAVKPADSDELREKLAEQARENTRKILAQD
jgi:hypothetical protein